MFRAAEAHSIYGGAGHEPQHSTMAISGFFTHCLTSFKTDRIPKDVSAR